MVNNCLPISWFWPGGWDIFEKEGTSEKRCIEIEDWGFSVHFVLRFRKIPFKLYTYVLAKILQNGAKFIQKLTPGFKNHMRNLDNFRQAVESPKSWNLMAYFWRKNTCFQLKHYIPMVYLISSVIFETKSHFSWHNSSVFISSNITYFLKK